MGLFDKIKKNKFDLDEELEKLAEFMDPVEQQRALRVRFMELQNEGKIKESMKLMETYERIERQTKYQKQKEVSDDMLKARKELFEQHPDFEFFFECFNCGNKISYEPKEYDRQIQCPKCKTTGTLERTF